jgi:hypothetical protein
MKKTSILLGYILTITPTWAGEKMANESIISTIQTNIRNTSIAAYAFCVPEFTLVLQRDTSVIAEFCRNMSGSLDYFKGETEDIYLTELLKIQLLKDSLSSYYSDHNEVFVKRLLDSLQKVPTPKLEKNKYYLFFKSFTDESGVDAIKIETLLFTQDLSSVFDYIQSNEAAKNSFLRWIDEDMKIWCPSFSSDNAELDTRIVQCLYDRLQSVSYPLAQQAAAKMKQWFGNDIK